MRRPAGAGSVVLWGACLATTVARLQGGTGGRYRALLAALVPWTLPVLAAALTLALVAARRPTSASTPIRHDRAHRRDHADLSAVLRQIRRALPVALVALPAATLVLHGAWVAPSDAAPAGVSVVRDRVRVLALNLEFGEADAANVVDVVRRERVDLLLAVELTPDAVRRLRAAGLDGVLPASVLLPAGGATGSGLWTRLPATPLPPVAGTVFRTPRARLTLPGGGTVAVTAAHPVPPLQAQWWQRDLGLIRDAAAASGPEPQIVGGDFNATRDHAPFRALLATGLTDAADAVGVTGGAWPGLTWPADRAFPPVMRLDHVLVSSGAAAGTSLAPSDVSTVEVPGTDHRGVLVTVTFPTG